MTKFVPKEVLGDSTFVSVYDPESGDTGYVRMGDLVDKSETTVTTVTGPDGVVEFPQKAVAQAIAALGQPNQYAVSDAELAALPPRLWPVDSLPYRLYRAHRGFAFGIGTVPRQLVRVSGAARVAENCYLFPDGNTIFDVFEGDGCILVCTVDADSKYSLWRSDDLGDTVTLVHRLGEDPSGTHHPNTWLLNNSLRVGKINGVSATVLASYNSNGAVDAGTMVPASFGYIAYSLDQCRTWQYLNIWNYDFQAGEGTKTIRHFHACHYDQWRDCWWFATGDEDAHSSVMRWDARTMGPIGNASPASIAAGNHPGWDCRYGSQRWRTVDFLVTEEWIETFTDTVSVTMGGIWRMRPDFTNSHRVNHDTLGIQHDGWNSFVTSQGLRLWCSNLRGDAVAANQRWVGIWGSMNGNRYSHIGRVAARSGASPMGTRGLFELDGKIWWSVLGEAGKGGGVSTNVYAPSSGKFSEDRPDFLGPVYFVDFGAGNDANNGYGQTTAWKTFGKLFGANAVTHGARIMLSAGTTVESGVGSIDYTANASPASDTTVGIQISGQGRANTVVRMLASGTNGWRGTSSQYWDVEISDATFVSDTTPRVMFFDNATQSAGKPKWTLRNCTVGDVTIGCTYTAWSVNSTQRFVRCEILNGPALSAVRAEGTAGDITLESSVVKGRAMQYAAGKIRMLNCEHAKYASVGFTLAADATVLPELKNVLYYDGSGVLFSNLSALDVSGVIAGCVYDRVPIGMPTSPLPVAGILDRDDNLTPFSWSALSGAGVSTGVKWGFDGRPMRKIPSIGAIEAE